MADYDNLKDPNAVLDWTFDWSGWLATSETISTSTFVVTPGITIQSTPAPNPTNATVWLSGGSPGVYKVSNRITTSQGRTDERTITIRVQER